MLRAFTLPLRSASAAAITSSTAIWPMLPRDVSTRDSVRHGAHVTGSDGPNSTTTGTPNAAAMCAGPLSLPMNRRRARHQVLHVAQRRVAKHLKSAKTATRRRAGPATNHRLQPSGSAAGPRPRQIARAARSFRRSPTQTDAAPRRASRPGCCPRDQLARAGSPCAAPPARTSPRPNVPPYAPAVLRPESPARAESCANKSSYSDDARTPRRTSRPRPASSTCCACRRGGSTPYPRGRPRRGEISSTSGLPSNTPAKRGSTTTRTRRSGR